MKRTVTESAPPAADGGPPPLAAVSVAPLASVPPDLTGGIAAPAGAAPPAPDQGWNTRTKALEVLAVLAVAYTLFFARAVLLPFTLAFVLALLFRPVVRHLRKRWHLNEYAGAAGVLAGAILALGLVLATLAVPAEDFARGIPEKVTAAAEKLENDPSFAFFARMQQKFAGSGGIDIAAAAENAQRNADAADRDPEADVEGDDPNLAALSAAGPAARAEIEDAGGVEAEPDPGAGDAEVVVVEERPPSLINRAFSSAPEAIGGFVLAFVFLYFLLAEGDAILNNTIALLPTVAEKRDAVELTRAAEKGVSRYLMLVSAINAALGVCIGLAMWAVGLPNPILWGVMATLLNFIPYVGAFVGAAVVFLVAYLEPDFSLGQAALAPLAYMSINLIEGNFVTPAVLGRTIALNPLMVLLSLAFWGWIWGPTGAVLAVPLLSMAKIVCDDVESLRGLGLLMGPRQERPNPKPGEEEVPDAPKAAVTA